MPGTSTTGPISELLRPLRRDRDLVFVDFRGTTAGHVLACRHTPADAELLGAVIDTGRVRACRRAAEARGVDARFYGNADIADDLEIVRTRLGYARIDLFGISGGTRVAQVYLARHGVRVRAAVLDGVVPIDRSPPVDFAVSAQRALDLLIVDCAADAVCRASHPHFAADVDTLFRRLRREPVRVDAASLGGDAALELDANDLAYLLRGLLYGADARRVPGLVRAAVASGDLAPLARIYLERGRRVAQTLSLGSHLAVYCREDLPFVSREEITLGGAGTFLGSYLAEQYADACGAWPVPPLTASERVSVRSRAPVLLLSGRLDPVTPPSYGEHVASFLPNAVHVTFPHGGHGFEGGSGLCRGALIVAFLRRPAAPPDTACVASTVPGPFR
jgi:pimeloyl-ACP methyl ester carboxylesterase